MQLDQLGRLSRSCQLIQASVELMGQKQKPGVSCCWISGYCHLTIITLKVDVNEIKKGVTENYSETYHIMSNCPPPH